VTQPRRIATVGVAERICDEKWGFLCEIGKISLKNSKNSLILDAHE
jgi:hypothetical protein